MPAGTLVSAGALVSPGGAQGPSGPVGPNAVSADAGNVAALGSDSKLYVPDPTPTIWSTRLRSFNAIGNPTFDVDQINASVISAQTTGKTVDRWTVVKASTGTMAISAGRTDGAGLGIPIPGTNFAISRGMHRIQLTTAQATLGANDYLYQYQYTEGPQFRELSLDIHSVSLLVRSSVVSLSFTFAIRDNPTTKSLVKLFTTSATPNAWTLIQLPNLPLWASGGNWSASPGTVGYMPSICLACGSSLIAPVTDTWQNGNFIGAPGMSNFAAQAVNSTFDIAFIQHEPGPVCTTPIDCPFNQNLDDCLRYFQKTYSYSMAPGTSSTAGMITMQNPSSQAFVFGHLRFAKPMAKIPTVTIYNPNTGVAGSIRDGAGVDHTGAAAVNIGDGGFSTISFTTAMLGYASAHYTADTGW